MRVLVDPLLRTLDRLAETGWLKPRPDGHEVFHPWGLDRAGYLVADPAERQTIRRALRGWFAYGALGMPLAVALFDCTPWASLVLTVTAILSVAAWTAQAHALTRGLPRLEPDLFLSEYLRESACRHGIFGLWIRLGISLVAALLGLEMLLRRQSAWFPAVALVYCGWTGAQWTLRLMRASYAVRA